MTTTATTPQQRWYAARQGETANLATNHYHRWTRSDIEFVAEFTETATDAEIALSLGRTLAAVWDMQHRLRTTGLEGVLGTFAGPRPTPTCSTHNIALTALGECDWC